MSSAGTADSPLRRPVITLYGVGPERASQLARLHIHTVEDLLLHCPARYEDRTCMRPIAELQEQQAAMVRGRVVACGLKWFRKRSRCIFELILDDGTARLHCRWWNLPFLENQYARGDELVAFGKVLRLKPRTMDHPETEVIEAGEEENRIHLARLTPVYPLTEGLPQRWLRALIWRTLPGALPCILESEGLNLAQALEPTSLPSETVGAGPRVPPVAETRATATSGWLTRLPTRSEAVRMLHRPENDEEPELGRSRLALDEFIDLQLQIRRRRLRFQSKAAALPCGGDNRLIRPFLARLGFKLTDAQTRVLREIRRDLTARNPMRRLLQGDVGSGKTVVAACCALMTLESGFGVALMAPTEILAEQHFRTFSGWLEPLGIAVRLRTGSSGHSLPPPRSPSVMIGTHALISEGFELPDLGLVVIDEQHKFGVAQREALVRKGAYPHLLVMTATPIPRTLGLTVYGDLDLSVIDELPPRRGRVQTFVRAPDTLPKVWEFVRSRLGEGRQAFVVYPRVEDTAGDVKAVTQECDKVRQAVAPHTTGLLHGRLPHAEKQAVMQSFRAGSTKLLLATSLVEVGVDVPNATVMVVENAEQFGLAQLHQLRGRIGRGAADSYCILVASVRTVQARERLKVLEKTQDGFEIAEADLRLRGPGELLGQDQSGLPRFRFGDLSRDWPLIQAARLIVARGNGV